MIGLEKNLIENSLGKQNFNYFNPDENTLDELKESLRRKTYWHIAGHGFYHDKRANDSFVEIGAWHLDSTTILGLESGHYLRLVNLSSCHVGRTDNSLSMADPKGLPYSFIEMGAVGVISAIWVQSDLSSALLMSKFYEYHIGQHHAPAKALANAQSWVKAASIKDILDYTAPYKSMFDLSLINDFQTLSDHTLRPFEEPYYWAGYYLLGS